MPCNQIPETQKEEIKEKDDSGKSIRTIAKETGLSEDTIAHVLETIRKKKRVLIKT